MRNLTFEELSGKEVISCCDCTRLGYISDVYIDIDTAQINAIVIELPCSFFSFFKRKSIKLPWDSIKKIGDDLIITEFFLPPQPMEERKSLFRRIFGK